MRMCISICVWIYMFICRIVGCSVMMYRELVDWVGKSVYYGRGE